MNLLHNSKTWVKLTLSSGLFLALLAAVIGTAIWSIEAIEAAQDRLLTREFKIFEALAQLRAQQDEQRIRIQELLLASSVDPRLVEAIERHSDEIRSRHGELTDLLTGEPKDHVLMQELIDVAATYRQGRAEQLKLLAAGDREAARALGQQAQQARFNRMTAIEQELYSGAQARTQAVAKRVTDQAAQAQTIMYSLGFIGLVGGLFLSLKLSRSIADPLHTIATSAEQIATGDLTGESFALDRADEVGQLARSFSRLAGNLRTQIGNLAEGVNVLSSAASQISTSTTQFAATAAETAAAVSETTTTVEELRQTALVSSQKAKTVSEASQNAAAVAQSGRKSVEEMIAGMDRIRTQMESIADRMIRLNEQSQSIGQIVTTVEDLAAQSNMLAVNAAIEAAKAGEQGKGFAVVAQEVRNLAEQSRQATSQVMGILTEVQKAINAAMLATEQGAKTVEQGATQAKEAGRSIQLLSGNVNDSAGAASLIAASSQQQLVGVDQVAHSMDSVKQASRQNADGAKQLEAAAQNLKALGERLQALIAPYKL